MPRLFVLDAMGLAYRAYYAFIARPLVNSRGENTSAIFGFANTVLRIRRQEKPDHWALAWDGPGPTWRHERFPDYKAQRKPTPEDLLAQLEPIETLAQALGLPVLEIPGMEADDVMATLAVRGARDGLEVVLVTGDKDMLQVVGGPVRVLVPQSREAYEWVDADAVRAKWGVGPEHIRDMLALMGDASDNIPGVPGVGEKTARELMERFGSLDAIYERLGEVTKPALKRRSRSTASWPSCHASWPRCAATSTCPTRGRTCAARPSAARPCSSSRSATRSAGSRTWRRAWARARSRPARWHRRGRAERRGTVSETPAEGVKLAAPQPAVPPPPPRPVAPPARGAGGRGAPRPVGLGRGGRGRRARRRCSPPGRGSSTRCAPAPCTGWRCCRCRPGRSRGWPGWWGWRWRPATAPPATSRWPTTPGPTCRWRRCATGWRRRSPTRRCPRRRTT